MSHKVVVSSHKGVYNSEIKEKRSSIRFFPLTLPHSTLSVLGMLMTEEREWREWQRRQQFPLHFEESGRGSQGLEMKEHSHNTSTIKGRTISKVVLVSCRSAVERWPHSLTLWRWKSKHLPLPPSFSCSYMPGLFVFVSVVYLPLLSLALCLFLSFCHTESYFPFRPLAPSLFPSPPVSGAR